MKAVSVAGYIMITFLMLMMTIQTYRFEQGASGAASYEMQDVPLHWGR